MVFSIPRTLDHINFGAWNSTENDENFYTFKSDSSQWRIPATSFKIGYTPLSISGDRFLILDPAFPNIYLPEDDFAIISSKINTLSNSPVCSLETGTCFYESSCD
jgi:hypothetical protein